MAKTKNAPKYLESHSLILNRETAEVVSTKIPLDDDTEVYERIASALEGSLSFSELLAKANNNILLYCYIVKRYDFVSIYTRAYASQIGGLGITSENYASYRSAILANQGPAKQHWISRCSSGIREIRKARAHSAMQSAYTQGDHVLLYSHSKIGWALPLQSFTKALSFEVKTNFGYGKSSYFHINLILDGVKITPFYDIIRFQFVNSEEIAEYSAKLNLKYSEWQNALLIVSDACNLAKKSKSAFIKKFIIADIEHFITSLDSIINHPSPMMHGITFFTLEADYTPMEEGHDLIEFQAKKAYDTTRVLNLLNRYTNICDVSSYVKRINSIIEVMYDRISIHIHKVTNKSAKISQTTIAAMHSAHRAMYNYKNLKPPFMLASENGPNRSTYNYLKTYYSVATDIESFSQSKSLHLQYVRAETTLNNLHTYRHAIARHLLRARVDQL